MSPPTNAPTSAARQESFRHPLWTALAAVVGIAACAPIFAGLDAVAKHLKLKRPPPFVWTSQSDSATVLYKREPILMLRGKDGRRAADRAQALAASLDSLFNQLDPPRFEIIAGQAGQALVRAGGAVVMELHPADTEGQPPLVVAREWVQKIEPLIRGKGTEAEGCPGCHIGRLEQVKREAWKEANRRW